jgi:hypothetical protein
MVVCTALPCHAPSFRPRPWPGFSPVAGAGDPARAPRVGGIWNRAAARGGRWLEAKP